MTPNERANGAIHADGCLVITMIFGLVALINVVILAVAVLVVKLVWNTL